MDYCHEQYDRPDPPAHSHVPGQPIQSYPLRPNHCHHPDLPVMPVMSCTEKNCTGQTCPSYGHCRAEQKLNCKVPVSTCNPLPPPIPPVRYIPGMDVQEQLTNMANHVNTCIDRWNRIQANCYEALNNVVGAAVSNDVYYDHGEVHYKTGYSTADGCDYQLIEARPVDRCGCPIVMRLSTAYNAGNGTARENIETKSFVTSANAIITARMTAWSGLCMVGGNPVSTQEAIENSWYAGWDDHGKLIILRNEEATIENATRRHIVDLIGPIIPIVEHGKKTWIAANFENDTPAAIQAIGWKKCNGNKVMFSCGFQSDPGCTVSNVADLLADMGVTTAIITCRQTAYGASDIGGFVVPPKPDPEYPGDMPTPDPDKPDEPVEGENTIDGVNTFSARNANISTYANPTTPDGSELGLTGGMMYIGNMSDTPINYQIPQNSAFWIISKRPPCGWNNRLTSELADIAQRLGSTSNQLISINGKLDIEYSEIIKLQVRTTKLEENDKKQDETIASHSSQISALQTDMEKAQQDIVDLNDRVDDLNERVTTAEANVAQMRKELTEEIDTRNKADQDLIQALGNETLSRTTADANLQSQIDLLKTTSGADIAAEAAAREASDKELQDQLNALSGKINFQDGPGIITTVKPGGIREIAAHIGSGIRFDSLNRIAVDPGPGIGFEGGKLIPILSKDFIINDKGEIEMVCGCGSDIPEAGVGLGYTVDETTGKQILNVLPPASGQIGGVKAGSGVTISQDGTISANGGGGGGEAYQLPPATKTTLGGVMVGNNLTVDENGMLSAPSPYVLPIASATTVGGVRVGQNLTIDENGVLNAQVPDPGDVGNGDTVLAGTGIDVVKDSAQNTATVNLSDETQATLTQVGENKENIDALRTSLNTKVNNVTYNEDQSAQNVLINKALGDAAAAQNQVSQIAADLETVQDTANTAISKADSAITTANAASTFATAASAAASDAKSDAETALSKAEEAKTLATTPATATTLGVVKVGSGLTVSPDGTLNAVAPESVPIATTETPGIVKPGSGLSITADGTITVNPFTIPYASTEQAGVVKVGSGLSVTEDGVLSADAQQVGVATEDTAGIVKPGDNMTVDEDGTLNLNEDTKSALQTAANALPKTGGVLSGPVEIGTSETQKVIVNPNGLAFFGSSANKTIYIGNESGIPVVSGNSASANGNAYIEGVLVPTKATQAANKSYVDSISNTSLIDLKTANFVSVDDNFTLMSGFIDCAVVSRPNNTEYYINSISAYFVVNTAITQTGNVPIFTIGKSGNIVHFPTGAARSSAGEFLGILSTDLTMRTATINLAKALNKNDVLVIG